MVEEKIERLIRCIGEALRVCEEIRERLRKGARWSDL